jgi:hypothetical protein
VTHQAPLDALGESVPMRRWPWVIVVASIMVSLVLAVVAAVVMGSPVMAAVWCICGLFFAGAALLKNVISVAAESDALEIRWLGRRRRIRWADLSGIEIRRIGSSGRATGIAIRTRDGQVAASVSSLWLGCPAESAAEMILRVQGRSGVTSGHGAIGKDIRDR